MFQAVVAVYVGLLLFETMPLSLLVCGIVAHLLYALVLKTFPFIELTSPHFIVSIGKNVC